MNGAEHYDYARRLILDSVDHARSPKRRKELREESKVYALLAIAAALGVNQPQTDPDEDSDGWELMMPGRISRNKPGAHWPPRRGDLWQDQRMRTWVTVPLAYTDRRENHGRTVDDGSVSLVCLDENAAGEERILASDMTLVFRPSLLADCPF